MAGTSLTRGASSINFRRALISSTQSPSKRNIHSNTTVQLDTFNSSPSLRRRGSLTNIFYSQSSCNHIKKNHWDDGNLRRQSSLTCLHTHSPNKHTMNLERSPQGLAFDLHRRYSLSGSLPNNMDMNDEQQTILGSMDNLTFTTSIDRHHASGSTKVTKSSANIRHGSYLPESTCLSRLETSQMSGLRYSQQRRQYNSMTNLKFEKSDESKSDNNEYGTVIGAAATATAAAIAMLIRDSPKVHASEASDGDDDDSADVEKKCQITRKTNIEKVYRGKGSFILQDLYTNALYLIQHDNQTASNEEGLEPEQINGSTFPDNDSNNNPEEPDIAKTSIDTYGCCTEIKCDVIEGSEDVDKKPEVSVTVLGQGDSNTKSQPKHIKLVRRGSGRTLNALTLTSLIPIGNRSEESGAEGANLQVPNEDNEIGPELKHSDEEEDDDEDSTDKKDNGVKRERIGFRDRKIIDYENRIRAYSTPDKIFRYFATFKSTLDSEIYMTPEDFLRSLTPGVKQPDGLGLDHFQRFDPETMSVKNLAQNLPEDSIFYKLGKSGLISFSDYVFMLTILSTSRRQFEIAFRMFDLNGDGDVDAEEFEQVQNIIRQTTTMGSRHRDHATTGNTLKGINSALAVYFFGDKLDGKLTIDRFLDFQQDLQTAILKLEFQRKDPDEEGKITEKQFAELILTYADYSPKKRSATLKRVKRKYKDKKSESGVLETPSHGILLEDYIQIFSVLIHIDDVDKALSFYNLAGASIDKTTLKHVAKVCAGVDLREHLVDVLFTIFDEDGDGVLSNKEFVSVMKNKLKRGLEKPKDIGIVNLFSALAKCAKSTPIPAAPTLVFTTL